MECKDKIPPSMYADVDTSRPFSSVKVAVAMFGQRIPLRESRNLYKPSDGPWIFGTLSPGKSPRGDGEQGGVEHALKKLEAELSEAKEELRLLKKRETDTEVAVAALNAEFHRSISRLAKAEADPVARRLTGLKKGKEEPPTNEGRTEISSYSSTLAQILSVAENGNGALQLKPRGCSEVLICKTSSVPASCCQILTEDDDDPWFTNKPRVYYRFSYNSSQTAHGHNLEKTRDKNL